MKVEISKQKKINKQKLEDETVKQICLKNFLQMYLSDSKLNISEGHGIARKRQKSLALWLVSTYWFENVFFFLSGDHLIRAF